MSISILCSCGARLEIDPKFAGQSIACPDCHKSLVVTPPPPPATRTSSLAVASVLVALVGAWTVVGTLLAMILGAIAYRRIPKQHGVDGQAWAKAGVVLGGVFTLLALAAYWSGSLAGLDGLLRQYAWSGKLKFPAELAQLKDTGSRTYLLERPSQRWGVLEILPDNAPHSDRAMLVNVRDDAQIFWLVDQTHPDDDAFSLRSKAIEIFRASHLVRLVGKLPENAAEKLKDRDVQEQGRIQEFVVDAVLSGIERTFLFRVVPDGDRLNVLVGGARRKRFTRQEPELRRTLSAFKPELSK